MGLPGIATFKYYIANNPIQNCAIAIYNINRSQQIYGTPIPLLKLNTTKQSAPENHLTTIPLTLPTEEKHKDVHL